MPVHTLVRQLRRAAEQKSETIDIQGFDVLLELQPERGLCLNRIEELQDLLDL